MKKLIYIYGSLISFIAIAVLCISSRTVHNTSYSLKNNLIAYWDFDHFEKGIPVDLSKNHLISVNHNAVFRKGKKGYAFHGTGKGYLEVLHVPLLDSFPAGITVSAWVKRDSSSKWNCIITRQIANSESEYFDLGIFQNKPLFSVDPDGNNFSMIQGAPLADTISWHHLAGTFDNDRYILYVDGREKVRNVKKVNFKISDSNPWIIGSNTNDQGAHMDDFFYGLVDDLQIYNRPFSGMEINKLYLANAKAFTRN